MLTRASGNSDTQPMDTDININSSDHEKVPFIVVPLIHEITTNMTQLAEKRAMGPRKQLLLSHKCAHVG